MVTLIYILLFLAIWHFFYENVLATSLRHGLRYKFFSLRDELRALKINGLNDQDEKVYQILDFSICNLIKNMSMLSLGNYYILKSYFKDHNKLKREINATREVISASQNDKLIEIDKHMNKLGAKAFVINHGGWAYFIIPLIPILLFVFLIYQTNQLYLICDKIVFRLIYSPDIYRAETIFKESYI